MVYTSLHNLEFLATITQMIFRFFFFFFWERKSSVEWPHCPVTEYAAVIVGLQKK